MWDLPLIVLALLPLGYRAHGLGLIPLIVSTPVLQSPSWWLCLGGISLLYLLHAFIWHYPAHFTALCRPTGMHPVQVFAVLEIVGKLWQGVCVVAYLGVGGLRAAGGAIAAAPTWSYAVFALYLAVGQGLNAAMYAAIGNDGVYYGFRLGRQVPWCKGFPFNVGLRHPQYVGGVLTILGALFVLMSADLVRAGMVQAGLAWAGEYVAMSIMEQLSDNDKSKRT